MCLGATASCLSGRHPVCNSGDDNDVSIVELGKLNRWSSDSATSPGNSPRPTSHDEWWFEGVSLSPSLWPEFHAWYIQQ